MFGYLDRLEESTLISVVYEAGLLLYERERHRGLGRRFPALRGGTPDPKGEITALVHRILADIEKAERTPFTELSQDVYAKYQRLLSGRLWRRIGVMTQAEREHGQRLLEELRRDYYPSAA